jgi:transposase
VGDTEPELRELPNDPHHIRRLFERLKREGPVVACYEAGVSGYDLYRQIVGLGVACDVIAPALTPRRPGQRIKTDRRDAAKLVRFFRAGELTAIHVPAEVEEAGRDLIRCRDDIRRDVLRWRHRTLKLLTRHGRNYLGGKNWSRGHWTWLRTQIFDLPPLQRAFEATLFALEQALARQAELDKEIEALALTDPYREPVGWLRCFRGLDTLSAMILVAEIVDFQRFRRPRELMAYLGLVPTEYSSGDTQRRGALPVFYKSGYPRPGWLIELRRLKHLVRIGHSMLGQPPPSRSSCCACARVRCSASTQIRVRILRTSPDFSRHASTGSSLNAAQAPSR